jgi:hypothetical protein
MELLEDDDAAAETVCRKRPWGMAEIDVPSEVLRLLGVCGFLNLADLKSFLAVFGATIRHEERICMLWKSRFGYPAIPREFKVALFADRAAWKQVITMKLPGQKTRRKSDIPPIEWARLLFHTNCGPVQFKICIFNVGPVSDALKVVVC